MEEGHEFERVVHVLYLVLHTSARACTHIRTHAHTHRNAFWRMVIGLCNRECALLLVALPPPFPHTHMHWCMHTPP